MLLGVILYLTSNIFDVFTVMPKMTIDFYEMQVYRHVIDSRWQTTSYSAYGWKGNRHSCKCHDILRNHNIILVMIYKINRLKCPITSVIALCKELLTSYGLRVWDSLPDESRIATTVNSFITVLENHCCK